jgi:hypothetical protein
MKLTRDQIIERIVAERTTNAYQAASLVLSRSGIPNPLEYLLRLRNSGRILVTGTVCDGNDPLTRPTKFWSCPERIGLNAEQFKINS